MTPAVVVIIGWLGFWLIAAVMYILDLPHYDRAYFVGTCICLLGLFGGVFAEKDDE